MELAWTWPGPTQIPVVDPVNPAESMCCVLTKQWPAFIIFPNLCIYYLTFSHSRGTTSLTHSSLFKSPTPWPSLPPFNIFVSPPLFYGILDNFQFPPPLCNPLLLQFGQPTLIGMNKYKKDDFSSSTVTFHQKSIFNLLSPFCK